MTNLPADVVHENVICPSCGGDDAIIRSCIHTSRSHTTGRVDTYKETKIEHSVCGYSENLGYVVHTMLDEADSHQLHRVTASDGQKLHINTYAEAADGIGGAIAKIQHFTNNIFTDIHVFVQDTPKHTHCPICQDNAFYAKDERVYCEKGHYSCYAQEFLQAIIFEMGYHYQSATDKINGSYLAVSQVRDVVDFQLFGYKHKVPGVFPVAGIYIRSAFRGEKKVLVLTVFSQSSEPKYYREFVDSLHLILDDVIEIIEAKPQ